MTKQRKQQQCTNHAVITSKRVIEVRWIIASVILLLIGVGTLLWILSSGASWTPIMPVAFLTILGLIIGLFQWLFPLSSDDPKTTMRVNATYSSTQLPRANSSDISEKIQEQATLLHASSSLPKFAYRGIAGVLPPTDPRTIQQRHKIVQEIYSQLIHRDTTAVVLTGMGGSGKSTIAALAYRYAEEQRQVGHGSFKAPAIWLHIDSASTMTDLAGNLFEVLDRPMPDFNNLSLQHQAQTLFNTLNMTNKPRLVILDQFENLLDWQTGYALPSRPGVDEWLDAMNGQPCQSRLIQKAWNCYRDAFKIAREMGDYEGEGKVLYNVGHYYLQQKRYDLSLASFLFAREAFSHVQSPYVSQIEQQILHLIKRYTLPDFSTYAKVDACQYTEQALQSF